MANELIINASLPETRIALMEDAEIQELLIERASGKGIVGNIYKGRVTRVLPGMQAAFVDIGLEKAAFLYVDDVYVHSEIWEEEEGPAKGANPLADVPGVEGAEGSEKPARPTVKPKSAIKINPTEEAEKATQLTQAEGQPVEGNILSPETTGQTVVATEASPAAPEEASGTASGFAPDSEMDDLADEMDGGYADSFSEEEGDDSEDDDDESQDPVKMGPGPDDDSSGNKDSAVSEQPEGTVAPKEADSAQTKTDSELAEIRKALSHEVAQLGRTSRPRKSSVKISAPVQAPVESSPEASQAVSAEGSQEASHEGSPDSEGAAEGSDSAEGQEEGNDGEGKEDGTGRRRHRRGRRGGKFRRKPGEAAPAAEGQAQAPIQAAKGKGRYPDSYQNQVADTGADLQSDRAGLAAVPADIGGETPASRSEKSADAAAGRPIMASDSTGERRASAPPTADGTEFRAQRSRDRRIRPKANSRSSGGQVNIQDLLKEGQEVLVQVAKDPIATKGARLTCHISLPGRHLVCMPTIDHVGVSRRIEREDERRRLRDFVERNRPRNLGFIVRTASGKQQSEKRIKQDIDYLTRLWTEIREKAGSVTAPSLVYEDLNAVLRAVRDWVTEETDKVIVDSRYHFNEIQRFVSHFMPSLKQKVELYHGDIPIFDAYGISTELSRALERKVWLKSGGYIVVDQAEALVAIDVNTGRYVGKKNLEDTILKTNLEAVQEIAYQLRLRNCGGIIILDLIDMEKEENKQRVYRALEDALQRDRARPSILKISELGLIEMTRKRTRDTIVRALCESCSHCEGKGFIKSKQTVAYEVMREVEREGIERDVSKILVQAHPDVIDILAIDERETLDQLERRYRKSIYLQAVVDFHPEQFEVTADKKEKAEQDREQPRGRGRDHSSREERSGGGDRQRGERDRHRQESRSERHSSRSGGQGQPGEGTGKVAIRATVDTSGAGGSSSEGEVRPRPVIIPTSIIQPVSERVVITTAKSEEGTPGNSITPGKLSADSEDSEDLGNALPASQPVPTDEFYDEEDRLAFLRAQAAQDAALARLSSGQAHPTRPANSDANRGGGGGGGDRGGKNRNMRNRRGGKFRRGNDRPADRGGRDRDRGARTFGPSQGAAPQGPKGNGNEGPREATPGNSSATPTPNQGGGTPSSGTSGPKSTAGTTGGSGDFGGGGDHTPPAIS